MPVEQLVETILETAPPHFGQNINVGDGRGAAACPFAARPPATLQHHTHQHPHWTPLYPTPKRAGT